MIEFTVSC